MRATALGLKNWSELYVPQVLAVNMSPIAWRGKSAKPGRGCATRERPRYGKNSQRQPTCSSVDIDLPRFHPLHPLGSFLATLFPLSVRSHTENAKLWRGSCRPPVATPQARPISVRVRAAPRRHPDCGGRSRSGAPRLAATLFPAATSRLLGVQAKWQRASVGSRDFVPSVPHAFFGSLGAESVALLLVPRCPLGKTKHYMSFEGESPLSNQPGVLFCSRRPHNICIGELLNEPVARNLAQAGGSLHTTPTCLALVYGALVASVTTERGASHT